MAVIFKCHYFASKALPLQCHEQTKYLCTHLMHFLPSNPVTDLIRYLNSKIYAYHSVVLTLPINFFPSSRKIFIPYCITTNQRYFRTLLYVREKFVYAEIRQHEFKNVFTNITHFLTNLSLLQARSNYTKFIILSDQIQGSKSSILII